jgi:(1->4)-alpha-D-glucan 1-alpha-D-glucosylmutase
MLTRIALSRRRTCDFTLNSLRDALTEIVASFPVYRTYVSPSGLSENDAEYIRKAVAAAKWRSPAADTSIFDFVHEVLLTRIADGQNAAYRNAVINFAMKFQQFTSPVMAKGLEDTAFYRYNRLVSLNDVGSDLKRFGVSQFEFHAANQERLANWPHTMLATSTHDTKRSEDVRSRINVLSEMSALWRLRARDWRRLNRTRKRTVNGQPVPAPNDEYLLYQTLVGAWPFHLDESSDKNEWKNFRDRIEAYMLKAIREAKQNSSWINRNAEYEDAVSSFVKAVLEPGPKNRFMKDFLPFQRRVARIGLWNSLSQTLLKLTAPGVPDIYQGNELWDLSLVDPDNRRPVDYGHRRSMFDSLRQWGSAPDAADVSKLLQTPEDGRMKLYLIWKTLCFRQEHPDLFQQGEYVALGVSGPKADRIAAFARRRDDLTALIIVPRLVAGLINDAAGVEGIGDDANDFAPLGPHIWEDTHIVLPVAGRQKYRNVLTGDVLDLEGSLSIAQALADFPVALFVSTQ